MRRPLAWLVAVGILAAAGVVVALKPQEQWAQGPIAVAVPLGVEGSGRNIQATVSSVALAETLEIELDDWRGGTEGVWVVFEVTAENRVEPSGLQSFLFIGDKEFRGSERLDDSGIETWFLTPGIPTTGVVAFEIPKELAGERAELWLGESGDVRLDSVIATTVELGSLTLEPVVVVEPARRIDP